MKDHYKILGISPASTPDEIKKAYRLLALKYHPDRNGGTIHSEEVFKEIAESYQVLGDASSRRSYDYWRSPRENTPEDDSASGKISPATFLHIFTTLREKVVNAEVYVSELWLFEMINNVLTTDNLNYLVGAGDVRTNGLIIDEIVTASVFLHDSSKTIIYRKLIRLAHGDTTLKEKAAALSTIEYAPRFHKDEEEDISDYVYFFIAMLIALVLFAVISGMN